MEKNSVHQPKKNHSHNLLVKLPGVTGRARNVEGILQTWHCFFTDPVLDTILTSTNQCIDSIREKFARERDAKLTDKSEIKAMIDMLYIAGIYKDESRRPMGLGRIWS